MRKIKLDDDLNVVVHRDFIFNVRSKSLGVHKLTNLLLAQAESGDTKIHTYVCDASELGDYLQLAGKDRNRAVECLLREAKEAYFEDTDVQHPLFEIAERAEDNSVIFKLSDFVFRYLPVFMGAVIKF